jgi:hypothetical protein
MTTENALALANHLASTLPQENEDFDVYMGAAIARWPDLTGAEVEWACARAADISRQKANRKFQEADLLRQITRVAKATGCPEGTPAARWLIEKGLLVETKGGFKFVDRANKPTLI